MATVKATKATKVARALLPLTVVAVNVVAVALQLKWCPGPLASVGSVAKRRPVARVTFTAAMVSARSARSVVSM